jgi:hypothetical protein
LIERLFVSQKTLASQDYSLASNDQVTSPPKRRQWTCTVKQPAKVRFGADAC